MTRRKKWLIALFIVIIVGLPLAGYIAYELGDAWTECLDTNRPDRTPDQEIKACSIGMKIDPKYAPLYNRAVENIWSNSNGISP